MTDLITTIFRGSRQTYLTPAEESHLIRTAQKAMDHRDRQAALHELAVAFAPALRTAAYNYLTRLDIHNRSIRSFSEVAGPLLEGFYKLVDDVDPNTTKPLSKVITRELANIMGEEYTQVLSIRIPWGTLKNHEMTKRSMARGDDTTDATAIRRDGISTYHAIENALSELPSGDAPGSSEAPNITGRIDDRILADSALDGLTGLERTVIEKLYLELKTVPEIATELGLQHKTVRTYRGAGLETMRQHLGVRRGAA